MFSSAKPIEHSAPFSEPDFGGEVVGGAGGVVEAFTPELREKMMRMEKEIQILRRRVEAAESAAQEGGVCIYDFGGLPLESQQHTIQWNFQ